MSIARIGNVGPSSQRDVGSGEPQSITRDGLVALQERITANGGAVPEGLDKLIQNCDAAAGKGGSMTREQLRAFAEKNGVKLPDLRGRGRGPGGAEGTPPRGGASRGAGGVKAAEKPSAREMAEKTRAQLVAATVKGDRDAIRELERRETEAAATRTRPRRPDGVGENLDIVA